MIAQRAEEEAPRKTTGPDDIRSMLPESCVDQLCGVVQHMSSCSHAGELNRSSGLCPPA